MLDVPPDVPPDDLATLLRPPDGMAERLAAPSHALPFGGAPRLDELLSALGAAVMQPPETSDDDESDDEDVIEKMLAQDAVPRPALRQGTLVAV